jgi:hypothetical protein
MLVNIPIDIIKYISEFLHVDVACRFLSFTSSYIKNNTVNKVCLYKHRIDSCLYMRSWHADNMNICIDSIHDFAQYYNNEHDFINAMAINLSKPGILHAYDSSPFMNHPCIWRYNTRRVSTNNNSNNPPLKGWERVCAVYFVPMGPLIKIRNRPNVAALIY